MVDGQSSVEPLDSDEQAVLTTEPHSRDDFATLRCQILLARTRFDYTREPHLMVTERVVCSCTRITLVATGFLIVSKEDTMIGAKRLAGIRFSYGTEPKVFAELCGLTYSTFWRLITGRTKITKKHIRKLHQGVLSDWGLKLLECILLEDSEDFYSMRCYPFGRVCMWNYYPREETDVYLSQGWKKIIMPDGEKCLTSCYGANGSCALECGAKEEDW